MIKLREFKPIAFKSKTVLIVSKKNKLFYLDLITNEIKFLATLKWSFKSKLLSNFKFLYRITRGGVRNGIVFDNHVYCTFEGNIWCISLLVGVVVEPKLVYSFSQGKSALHMSLVNKSISAKTGFDEGIYFGEYFSNPGRKSVNIIHIGKNQVLNRVFTFQNGEINHIHSIVFDVFRCCAWVLTGDFGKSSGIWQFGDNFKKELIVIRGDQIFRSCVAFAVRDGLLYATDSQFEPNFIRILEFNGNSVESKNLFPINGPCIYGSQFGDDFIFTTATEPNITSEYLTIKDLFSRKQGPGILENKSFVYLVSRNFQITELFSLEKDRWPYYLAQFGNILLPEGDNHSEFLVTFSIANKNNDHCMEIRMKRDLLSLKDNSNCRNK